MRNRVEDLFHDLADLTQEARARYFREYNSDSETLNEVKALLRFDSCSTDPLDNNIAEVAELAVERLDFQPSLCGPYRLCEMVGRGGMGTVYLAERVDGEISHQVAVKLLRSGSDDLKARQRFLAERQILATLSHPNIAMLLDAGHREDGQPYLVMEHVEGQPIDVYTADLGVRHKIRLFLKVCAAVSYLHSNLVVHRDLKPANILVTAGGEPKLLDFGIAKILDATADFTQTSMRLLTPDYASPEQVTGEPITTASDIYSLGAVLYRLLTGSSPHQFDTDSAAGIAGAITNGRIRPPSNLLPALPRDLDSVLMKALRREPHQRYTTVEQFAEDLENFIQSRPVRARKGDGFYRARKFVQRHWLPVAAVILSLGGLTGGVLVANHQRAIAQRRFVDVRQLSSKLFDIDTEVRKLAGSTKTRQLIVDASLNYLQHLSADAGGDPELALDLGNAYMRIARVQGVPISQNLGQMGQAEQNLKIAEGFLQSALLRDPGNRMALLRSAQVAHDRMLLARFNGRDEDALSFARKSAQWLDKFHATGSDKRESTAILLTYLNVADQHMLAGEFKNALLLCRRGSELAHALDSPAYAGTFLWVSGEVLRREGDLDQALQEMQESVRILQPASTNAEHGRIMNYVAALIHEGRVLGEDNAISLGRPEEAVRTLQLAFDTAEGLVHQDARDEASRGRLAGAGIALADILRASNPRRALAIYDHVIQHSGEIRESARFRRYEVSALAGASMALVQLGRPREARHRLDSAFERLQQMKSYPAEKIKPGAEAEVALSALADYQARTGNIAGAIEIYQRLLQELFAWGAKPDINLEDALDVSHVYATLASLLQRAHQPELASAIAAQRLQLWRNWNTRLPHNGFIGRQLNSATEPIR